MRDKVGLVVAVLGGIAGGSVGGALMAIVGGVVTAIVFHLGMMAYDRIAGK